MSKYVRLRELYAGSLEAKKAAEPYSAQMYVTEEEYALIEAADEARSNFVRELSEAFPSLLADLEAAETRVARMLSSMEKVAAYHEAEAARCDKNAEDCRFPSLKDAYVGDAKNHRKIARDLRDAANQTPAPPASTSEVTPTDFDPSPTADKATTTQRNS